MRIVRAADCPEVPWKNGAGTTRELYVDGALRVTLASERANAPFSDFEGWTRTIVPLAEGLSLAFANERFVALKPFRPFVFSGAPAVRSILENGALDAFNVMTRDEVLTHTVELLDGPDAMQKIERTVAMIYIARGALELDGITLGSGTLASVDGVPAGKGRLTGSVRRSADLMALAVELALR